MIEETVSTIGADTPVMDAQLERNAVGPIAILFQAITTAGPAAGVASGLVFAASYAGGSTPLTIALATAAMLLVAFSIGELAKHLPSAGGLYTYTAAGLGERLAFVVAWLLVLGYVLIPPLVALLFAYVAQINLSAHADWGSWTWYPLVVLCTGGVWLLTYLGVKLSTKVGVVLGTLEIIVFVVLAWFMVIDAGSRNTLSVFGTHLGNTDGLGSVFAGMIYAVLAFIGFDGAAPIAEETSNSRKTVPTALVGSVAAIGAFFLFCMYAIIVYWGPGAVATGPHPLVALNGGDPFSGVAQRVWGGAWVLVVLAVMNSAFASTLGATNAATRIGFALGRIRVLPTALANTHAKHKTPHIAVHAQALATLSIALILGAALGGPVQGFGFLGAIITILFVVIYALASLSCTAYYRRERRHEFRIVRHVLVPALAAAFFVPVLIASLGINFVGLGIAPLTGSAAAAPIVAGVWLGAGILVLVVLARRHPIRIHSLGQIFVETDPPAQAGIGADDPPPA
jgi:amino acid transporter